MDEDMYWELLEEQHNHDVVMGENDERTAGSDTDSDEGER